MSDSDSQRPLRPASVDGASSDTESTSVRAGPPARIVSFDRRELAQIFKVYGRLVAEGEWRDYAIDMLKDRAVFSIFRRTSEMPLYRVEKDPNLARRQGTYSVVAAGGLVLKRGHDLERVLRVFDRRRFRLID